MGGDPELAAQLLHLPDKPAGVEQEKGGAGLAAELLHLPDKPAGVDTSPSHLPASHRTASPAGQAGRGPYKTLRTLPSQK